MLLLTHKHKHTQLRMNPYEPALFLPGNFLLMISKNPNPNPNPNRSCSEWNDFLRRKFVEAAKVVCVGKRNVSNKRLIWAHKKVKKLRRKVPKPAWPGGVKKKNLLLQIYIIWAIKQNKFPLERRQAESFNENLHKISSYSLPTRRTCEHGETRALSL